MTKSINMACLMALMTLFTFAGGRWLKADCPNQGPSINNSCTTNMPFPMLGGSPTFCANATTMQQCNGNILDFTNLDSSPSAAVNCLEVGVGPPAPVTSYSYYTCTWDPMGGKCKATQTTVTQGSPVYSRCTEEACVAYWREVDLRALYKDTEE